MRASWDALWRANLARKFILLTSMMILATVLLLLLFVLAYAREFSYRELLSHGLSVATIMAQNSSHAMANERAARWFIFSGGVLRRGRFRAPACA